MVAQEPSPLAPALPPDLELVVDAIERWFEELADEPAHHQIKTQPQG